MHRGIFTAVCPSFGNRLPMQSGYLLSFMSLLCLFSPAVEDQFLIVLSCIVRSGAFLKSFIEQCCYITILRKHELPKFMCINFSFLALTASAVTCLACIWCSCFPRILHADHWNVNSKLNSVKWWQASSASCGWWLTFAHIFLSIILVPVQLLEHLCKFHPLIIIIIISQQKYVCHQSIEIVFHSK